MFHGIPVVKMLHVTYFHRAIERVRHLKIGLLHTKQEKCAYKLLLKKKIHDLMKAFPLDAESHYR